MLVDSISGLPLTFECKASCELKCSRTMCTLRFQSTGSLALEREGKSRNRVYEIRLKPNPVCTLPLALSSSKAIAKNMFRFNEACFCQHNPVLRECPPIDARGRDRYRYRNRNRGVFVNGDTDDDGFAQAETPIVGPRRYAHDLYTPSGSKCLCQDPVFK